MSKDISPQQFDFEEFYRETVNGIADRIETLSSTRRWKINEKMDEQRLMLDSVHRGSSRWTNFEKFEKRHDDDANIHGSFHWIKQRVFLR